MSRKRNAPARKGEGAVCLLGRDTGAYSMADARLQYLAGRLNLSFTYAAIIAPLAFGEMGNA